MFEKEGSILFASTRFHENRIRKTKDDLESLFYTILDLIGIPLPWDVVPLHDIVYLKRDYRAVRVNNNSVFIIKKKIK